MPSRFPGMDPFLESQKWKSFHTRFITNLGDALTTIVRPRYVVDVEENVYVGREGSDLVKAIAPDVAVMQQEGWLEFADGVAESKTAHAVLTLPKVDPVEEHYLVIRSADDDLAITVIELLSPTNKRSRDGRTEYLNKRIAVLQSEANLVEIDLLRGGQRLPTIERLPIGDYYAFVARAERRPKVEVYSWPLEGRLPTIAIPLAEGDPDVQVDLQAVFDTTYDRGGYDYALKYSKPIDPPLSECQSCWIAELLAMRPGTN